MSMRDDLARATAAAARNQPPYRGPWVRVRFIRVWGHPTRNLIMGAGDTAKVSPFVAGILCGGEAPYAEYIESNWPAARAAAKEM